MKKIFSLVAMFLVVAVLSGCSLNTSTPGANVEIDGENVKVNTPGANVDVKNGESVSVNTGTGSDQSGATTQTKSKNLIIILDASGSMNEIISGERKIDVAKKSINSYVDKMGSDVNKLGVIAYGHIGSNSQADKVKSCDGIEDVYYIGSLNKELVKSKINAIPVKGWTPIAKSLEKAKTTLAAYPNDENRILLVSDGEETCGGDPIQVAKLLKNSNVKVDVIGFDVSGSVETQLKNISIEGGGGYISIKNGNDFSVVINNGTLEAVTPGAYVNIQGGAVKVDTNAASVSTDGDTTKVKTDAGTVDTSKPNAGVSVPNVSIPNY